MEATEDVEISWNRWAWPRAGASVRAYIDSSLILTCTGIYNVPAYIPLNLGFHNHLRVVVIETLLDRGISIVTD